MSTIKKAIRSLQVMFPWLLEGKFLFQRFYRRMAGMPFEGDFEILKYIDFDENKVCLDVGCNRGQSIDAIRLYKPEVRILAFEPNVGLFEKLQAVFKNDKNISLYNFGLSDASGEFDLFVPVYKSWVFDGLASFSKGSAEGWLDGSTMYFYNEKNLSTMKMACSVRVLDDLQCAPCFIKIDVQGLERSVLKGGHKTIEKHMPVLLIETEDCRQDVADFLPKEYIPCEYNRNILYAGQYGEQNTVFMTQKHLDRYEGRIVNVGKQDG